MNKSRDLLESLGKVLEDDDKKEDDKDLVPINEPEPAGDDFSDLNVSDDNNDKKEKGDEPDEFTVSVLKIFKHSEDPDEEFDPDQLAAGIKVEAEHTDNKWIQKAVAKAHLAEYKEYYLALAKMEAELKNDKKDTSSEEDKDSGKEEKDVDDSKKDDENDV